MIKNYFKIAFRNLISRKFYTAINVFGLSLGIGCSIILFQFITYHLSFDTYHHNAKQLYKVVTELRVGDGSVIYDQGNSIALANSVRAKVPQAKDVAILFKIRKITVGIPQKESPVNKLFAENGNIALTDAHFFNLFDYEWEQGDKSTALKAPNTIVLSHSIAQKYFGSQDVIGKFISVDSKNTFKITGIVKDHAANTDIKTDIFLSLSSLKSVYPETAEPMVNNWGWIDSKNSIYVSLANGTSTKTIEAMIKKMDKQDLGDTKSAYTFVLQPLKEVHFDGRYGGVIQRSLLLTLGIIGFLLLVIACVNFINMATAQSFKRAKEIGTRKVLGSSPSAIFIQFITETACIVLFAALLAVVWVIIFLPILNTWLQTELHFNFLRDYQLSLFLMAVLVIITLAAGSYPAIILSRFKPVNALKNQVNDSARSTGFARKGLIVFQNVIAQVLIIGAILITMQVKFLKSAGLGFNKDAVVVMPVPDNAKNKTDFLRNQLLAHPDIKNVTYCDRPAASTFNDGGSVKYDKRNWENFTGYTIMGDASFAQTFGLKIIAGRNIAESDTASEYLVNEMMVKRLGVKDPQQIIGHQFVAGGITNNPGIIVGVIKDFHAQSLYTAILPESICAYRKSYRFMAVKISGNNASASIERIKNNWQSVYPESVFEYRFQDEQINDFYQKEDLLNKLIRSSALIAIFISCLGLLGLISLLTLQRTKEIGIRKVLGASVTSITSLLTVDFLKLIVLAVIIASPIAWLMMSKYLQNFAYRIDIHWWVFAISALSALLITFVTVSYQSIKAAIANPVKSLRSE
ncbi:ABC transporter permease [Mucilaginibacter sp.]|jgi:putative ABC transport system permease protein|uniref:ABC transporter permease n=1 Tax=Mucilaginibacter sp. TaxID=1882438 RepID=UPI00356A91B4